MVKKKLEKYDGGEDIKIVLMVNGDGKESSLYLHQIFCIKTSNPFQVAF